MFVFNSTPFDFANSVRENPKTNGKNAKNEEDVQKSFENFFALRHFAKTRQKNLHLNAKKFKKCKFPGI